MKFKFRHVVSGLFVASVLSSNVFAAPVQVIYGDIVQSTIETFEGDFPGTPGPSIIFEGFTASATDGNLQTSTGGPFSCSLADVCLLGVETTGTRTFDAFNTGTTAFGFDLNSNSTIDLTVSVTGNSGVAAFNITGAGLFGFSDPTGLNSVSFVNNVQPNYAFDDVITEASVVPIPPAVWLFGSGLLGLIGISRRKKST